MRNGWWLMGFLLCRGKTLLLAFVKENTIEARFNEPLYNEVLDITNDFLHPGLNYNKIYGTEPWYNEPRFSQRYNEHNPETQT